MPSADDVLSVVRVHADRVHDAVRRLGCAPETAVEVVETSALDLVDTLQARPDTVGDLVGWWFARARDLGHDVADHAGDLPLGGGVLGSDRGQARLAEALEARPERELAALLLRDSYDLPAASVGTALGLDPDAAMATVAAGRLALLPALVDGPVASLRGHAADLAALGRLGEGGQVATRDAIARRHTQSCDVCSAVVHDQERARRLLRGLTVLALPDGEREALLTRVAAYAAEALPAGGAVLVSSAAEPRRRALSLPLVALGVLLAVALGLLVGYLLSRPPVATAPSARQGPLPLVDTPTPAPAPTAPAARATVTAAPSLTPSYTVFTVTPTPAPTTAAPVTATTTPPPVTSTTAPATVVTEPLSLTLSPTAGPNGTVVTATGRGWSPGQVVTLTYRDPLGNDTGSGAQPVVDARGRFTTTLTASDPTGVPGRHAVDATDGTHTASAPFTARS